MGKQRFMAWLTACVLAVSAWGVAGAREATVEDKIRSAIQNRTDYAFMIGSDHIFTATGVGAYVDISSSGKTTTYEKPDSWTHERLIESSAGFVVRIDRGVVSMGDSTEYTCRLEMLSAGVRLHIEHTASQFEVSSIDGTIQGNTLTAHEDFTSSYYFAFTKSGSGYLFSGDFVVSVLDVAKSQVAPQPVALQYSKNKDRSITLSWVDPTPGQPAAYYEIYRALDVASTYTLVATVSGCTSWTDSSKETTAKFRTMASYYIISYNSAGVASEDSNWLYISIFNYI